MPIRKQKRGSGKVSTCLRNLKKSLDVQAVAKTLYDAIPDGIITADVKTRRIIKANPGACKLFGYSQSEFLAKHISRLHPASQVQKALRLFRRLARGEETLVSDIPCIKKNGTVFFADIAARPVVLGGHPCLVGLFRDVTERKRAAEVLLESEERYRSLLETTRTGYVVLDVKGRVLDANQEYIRFTGYQRLDQIRGKSVVLWTAAREKKNNAKAVRECLSKGHITDYETAYVDRHGRITPILINATVVGPKKRKRILTLCRDISGIKRTDESLKRALSLERATLESTADGILVVDKGGKVADFNERFVQLWRIPKEILVGRDDKKMLRWVLPQLENPKEFVSSVTKLYRSPRRESLDILKFRDGRVFERYSCPRWIEDKTVGRVWSFRDITKRSLVARWLRESEEKFRSVTEQSPNMIFINQDGKVVYANRQCERTMGYKIEEFYAPKFNFLSLIHPEDRPTVRRNFQRHQRGEEVPPYEYKLVAKNGAVLHAILASRLIDFKGRKAILGIITDITERKRAAEALKRSELEKQLVLGNIPELVVYQNARNQIIWANSSCAKAFGKTVGELKGAVCYKIFHNRNQPCAGCPVNKSKKTGCLEYAEMVSPDGRSWLISGSPIKDASGAVTGVVEVAIDITARKKSEHDLLASETRYRRLFEASKDGILILNAKTGMIEDVNPYLTRLLGYPRHFFLKKKLWELGFFKDTVPNKAHFLRLQRKKYVRYDDRPLRASGGRQINVEFVSNVYHVDNQRVIQCNIRDITERKKAADAFNKIQALLNEMGSMARVGGWELNVGTQELTWTDEVFAIHEVEKTFKPSVARAIGFYAASSKPVIRDAVRRAIQYGEPFDLELEFITAKGRPLWVHATGKSSQKGGKSRVVFGTFQDITERKNAEQVIRESEERFRVVVENSMDLVYRRNIQTGCYDFFSPVAKKILGYSPKELIGKGLSFATSRVHPDDLTKVARVLKKTEVRGQKSGTIDYRCKHKDGSYRWLSDRFTIVDDAKGRPLYWVGVSRDITAAKISADELRSSKEQLQLQLQRMPFGCILWSPDFRAVSWNPAAEEIFGYKASEAKGKKAFDLIVSKKVRRDVAPIWKRLLRGDATAHSVNYNVTKSGETILCRWTNTPLRDIDGKIFGVLSMVEDITEQRRGEEALSKSEARFRTIYENAPVLINAFDRKGRCLLWNKECEKVFGWTAREVCSMTDPLRLFYPNPSIRKQVLDTVIDKPEKVFREWHPVNKKGEAVITMWANFRLTDGMVINLGYDITERKRAEDAILEHRLQLRQIIDTVPHMVFAKDRQDRFLLVNRAVGAMYGKEPHELISKRHQDVHPVPQECRKSMEVDRQVLATGKPMLIPDEVFTDVRSRQHILQTIKIPFKMVGLNEEVILGVSVDVTEQKKVEEFRNDIVRTVSHELRTPLSIQKEGVNLVLDGSLGPLHPKQEMVLQTVMRSINRLSRLIGGLLDISRIESGKIELRREKTVLEDLARDLVFEFRKKFEEKGLELRLKSSVGTTEVMADPDKITQVLSNLIENAFKFTEKGGVEISLVTLNDEIECTVQDTGLGIAPGNVEKAFEKFQQFGRTAGPGEKGLGLGLSISKEIIGLHGGSIWAQSELGKGTRVTFTLPRFDVGVLKSGGKGAESRPKGGLCRRASEPHRSSDGRLFQKKGDL